MEETDLLSTDKKEIKHVPEEPSSRIYTPNQNIRESPEYKELQREFRNYYNLNQTLNQPHPNPDASKVNPNQNQDQNTQNNQNYNDPKIHQTPFQKFILKSQTYLESIYHYLSALFSVILAVFLIYYTNFFYNLFTNKKVDKTYFIIFLVFFVIFVLFIFYLCIILPCQVKEEEEYDKVFDKVIPYATICGVVFMICLINAVWPLWWIYSIFIVGGIVWGFIMSANFAPNGKLGSIFFLGLCVASGMSPWFIKGEGHFYGRKKG